jgi:hypothetical protein
MTIREQYQLASMKENLPELDGIWLVDCKRRLNEKLIDPKSHQNRDTLTHRYTTSVPGLTLESKHFAVQGVEDIRIELTVFAQGLELIKTRWWV